jgi:lysozyme
VSLAYNIGIRAFANSTLLRVLNEGNFDRVPEQFMRWVYNDEVFMKGLKIRREKEVVLWNKEPEDGDETPVSKTRSLLEIIISILRKLFK